MSLTHLSSELLDEIIRYSLPEGFESLALTCKLFYELCTPLIEEHNRLSCEFQRFNYIEEGMGYRSWKVVLPHDPKRPIRTAFDLITRIAVKPILARYIRDAELYRDSWPTRARLRQIVPDADLGGPVVALFSSSAYLREAGLDWKQYYAIIKEDLSVIDDYSQHAATFLLTLLPNIKTLRLPRLWKSLDTTTKLLDVVVSRARKPCFVPFPPSLAQVSNLGSTMNMDCLDLECTSRFLALPRIKYFRGYGFTELGDGLIRTAPPGQYHSLGEHLQTINLPKCCLDAAGMTSLLKHTPHLRSIFYSHCTERIGPRNWDICQFISAIEDRVGSHLIELSLSIEETSGPILPGKLSIRGFHRLQKLQLPIQLAMLGLSARICDRDSSPETAVEVKAVHYSIGDLVPATVSRLRLTSKGGEEHGKALEALFRHLATEKKSKLRALKEVLLDCPAYAGPLYTDRCETLQREAGDANGNVEFLLSSSASMNMEWEGEWLRSPLRKQKGFINLEGVEKRTRA